MFRCQACNVVVPARTRSHRVVVKTRPKTYPSRGSSRMPHVPAWRRRRMKMPAYDKGGEGTEIVQELVVCPACAKQYAESSPQSSEPEPQLAEAAPLA